MLCNSLLSGPYHWHNYFLEGKPCVEIFNALHNIILCTCTCLYNVSTLYLKYNNFRSYFCKLLSSHWITLGSNKHRASVNVHTWHYLSVSSLPSTVTILSQMYQNIQPAVIMIITLTIIIIILLIIINLRWLDLTEGLPPHYISSLPAASAGINILRQHSASFTERWNVLPI